MYDVVYGEIKDAGVAVKIKTTVFTDHDRNEVSEKGLFGLEQNIEISKSDYFLFADETGYNTSQDKDVNVVWTKFIFGEWNCT